MSYTRSRINLQAAPIAFPFRLLEALSPTGALHEAVQNGALWLRRPWFGGLFSDMGAVKNRSDLDVRKTKTIGFPLQRQGAQQAKSPGAANISR